MQTREITCIECPTGCAITATLVDGIITALDGFGCRRGHDYAVAEIERPERILTTTVPACGLKIRMAPVRTSKPVPRAMRDEAMQEIRKARVTSPLNVGDVVIHDLLGLGVDVIATREME